MITRGSLVVCLAHSWIIEELPIICPQKGQIYTVRDMRESPEDTIKCAILLVEIKNPVMQWEALACEPYFDINWFRPVPKTDISIFTKMLLPSCNRILAPLNSE